VLNQRGEQTWGEGNRKSQHWRGAYLRKIATSKAPIGMFTPHKTTHDRDTGYRRDVPQDPVAIFPAAVDEELYWRVARRLSTTAPRGRNATREVASVVAGIIKCATCGSAVIRVSKGKNPKRGKENIYLVCSRAHARAEGCTYRAVQYGAVEEALRTNARAIVRHAPRGKDTAEIEQRIENLRGGLTQMDAEVGEAAEFAAHERSPAATEAFRKKEAERDRLRGELRELQAKRETLTTASVKARLDAVRAALTRKAFNVAEANTALKQAVKKITMDPAQGTLDILWHHSEEAQEIHFHSRHVSWEATDLSTQQSPKEA
jgi:hypothetical protein